MATENSTEEKYLVGMQNDEWGIFVEKQILIGLEPITPAQFIPLPFSGIGGYIHRPPIYETRSVFVSESKLREQFNAHSLYKNFRSVASHMATLEKKLHDIETVRQQTATLVAQQSPLYPGLD